MSLVGGDSTESRVKHGTGDAAHDVDVGEVDGGRLAGGTGLVDAGTPAHVGLARVIGGHGGQWTIVGAETVGRRGARRQPEADSVDGGRGDRRICG